MPFTPWSGSSSGGGQQAYQFRPETYGALGNGKLITDAVILGGALTTLTSASAGFTTADSGKNLLLATTPPQVFTIQFATATSVTLNVAATGAVAGVGAAYGTDDTAALQTTINTATTYAQANNGYAEILFGAKLYCVAGSPTANHNSTAQNNAQLYLPIIPAASPKVTLKFTGTASEPYPHWLETGPPVNGSTLLCMRIDGVFDATYLWASVLAGPVNGYGGILGTFSNMFVIMDGLTALVHNLPTYGGLDLWGCVQADIRGWSFLCLAQPPAGGPWPQYPAGGPSGTGAFTYGYRSPAQGNNAVNVATRIAVVGSPIGVVLCDHFNGQEILVISCVHAVIPIGVASGGFGHLINVHKLTAENNTDIIFGNTAAGQLGTGGRCPVLINIASELTAGGIIVNDSSNLIYGEIRFEDSADGTGPVWLTTAGITGAANVKVMYLFNQPGPVPTPHAVPASGSGWFNGYFQNAEITLNIAAGTLSALTITGGGSTVSQTVPGSTTFYRFQLPAAGTYTPTYTGTLTHTVTLLPS